MERCFGTDGIRGVYGKTLTPTLAFSVGNALCQIKSNPSILIGNDTRPSAHALVLAFCAGAVQGGAKVTHVGILPTAGVSYLAQKHKFDFGIVVTASHNPPEFNGIKIFSSSGRKLSDEDELKLESLIGQNVLCETPGSFQKKESLAKEYLSHLTNCGSKLCGMKICLDCSNGASYKIAPAAFKNLGAEVFCTSCSNNGKKINSNCGSLHIHNLQNFVLKNKADVGFAFDGDADRVIAVDKNGDVFDGDQILYILACQMKAEGKLYANSVVGTSHTNSGISVGLNRHKINLIRTDIGDKYVIEAMEKMNLRLGGEQSGHIILKDYAQTGDGILTAIKVSELLQKTGKTLCELFDARLIFQQNINILTADKIKVLNNEMLQQFLNKIAFEISPAGRVLVRASGTENKIRVMVEHPNAELAISLAEQIKSMIEAI